MVTSIAFLIVPCISCSPLYVPWHYNTSKAPQPHLFFFKGCVEPGHEDLDVTVSQEFARFGLYHSLDLMSGYSKFLHQLEHEAASPKPLSAASKKRKKRRKKRDLSRWEPAFTNLTLSFRGTLDYIWFTTRSSTFPSDGIASHEPRQLQQPSKPEEDDEDEPAHVDDAEADQGEEAEEREPSWTLRVCGVLEPVNEDRLRRGRPKGRVSLLGPTFPSDHCALMCELALTSRSSGA